MNPIENPWGIMAREVYVNARQFDYVDDIEEAIMAAWERIPLSTLQRLADSMTDRWKELLDRGGGQTKY